MTDRVWLLIRVFLHGVQVGFFDEVVRYLGPVVRFCEQARDDARAKCDALIDEGYDD